MIAILLVFSALSLGASEFPAFEPCSTPLDFSGDPARGMVAGIDRFLMRELAAAPANRAAHWQRNFSSHAAYEASIADNREHLKTILGVVDARMPPMMEMTAPPGMAAALAEAPDYGVYEVRWAVLEGIEAEGLLLEPRKTPRAAVIALADCDVLPEALIGLADGVPPAAQFARRLAESGCRVVIPVLIDRRDTWSGHPAIRMTNQPHREFVYRAAFEMGRHIIGYEVQKVLAAMDWLRTQSDAPVGVIGHGEGGLLAFYAAAVDPRIAAAVVSGYFGPREGLWEEPIYRNVWGLLEIFGDAEIATLIAPRTLVVETADAPSIDGPPHTPRRSGGAPGRIRTPDPAAVTDEFQRARNLLQGLFPTVPMWMESAPDGLPGQPASLRRLLAALGAPDPAEDSGQSPALSRPLPNADARLKRQFDQIMEHTQRLMRESPQQRAEFWTKADTSSLDAWKTSIEPLREYLWDEVIGRFPEPMESMQPRSRLMIDTPAYRAHEIMLDVYPDVFAYGILLVPKDILPGERRSVVVCQHGLEGRPNLIADPRVNDVTYIQFGCRLAERGYIVYAPQNPYIGGDSFRVLQRKANPLKKSLFAIIVRQHQQALRWLAGLPFVDAERIAFYGLSYGGKTAMRVPALLDGYCLSICSADFNEWIWKNVSNSSPYSYLFTGEYEMPEFNLGNTFNYAELSWLILPRPFMVERGHRDGVAPDEWVAYEFARTRRQYVMLGIGDRAQIALFDGPHAIHGVETFAFLDRHLGFVSSQEK